MTSKSLGNTMSPTLYPRLEIAVPTRGRVSTLMTTIRALERIVEPWETVSLLVVDNATPDFRPEDLQRESTIPGRLRVFQNSENIGGGKNVLKCIELATADYVLVLSDEDLVNHSEIGRLLDFLMRTEALCVSTGVLGYGVNWSHRGVFPSRKAQPKEFFDASFYLSGIIFNKSGVAMLAERIKILADSNEMARLYPQSLLFAFAVLEGRGFFYSGISIFRGKSLDAEHQQESVPYGYPSKRARQLEGAISFLREEIWQFVDRTASAEKFCRQMAEALYYRYVFGLQSSMRFLYPATRSSLLRVLGWKLGLTWKRLTAQIAVARSLFFRQR